MSFYKFAKVVLGVTVELLEKEADKQLSKQVKCAERVDRILEEQRKAHERFEQQVERERSVASAARSERVNIQKLSANISQLLK